MSGRVCSVGRTVFFEAQPLGVQEHPDGAPVALDAAPQKLRRQAPGRERPRPAALAQPRRRLSRQRPLLVTADLARRERARLALQLHPLRHAGRADPQRRRDRSRRLARLVPGHRSFAKILRIGSRHPCRPPPAPIESRSSRFANPRFRQIGACSKGDADSCEPGKSKPMSKADFQAYLARPEVLSDIDNGTLNIEQKYLACRATTVSPGGPHRSKNQPFWNAPTAALSIISDAQITAAVNAAVSPTRQFSFMKSADVRTRLNELACSGCHQARAIAG